MSKQIGHDTLIFFGWLDSLSAGDLLLLLVDAALGVAITGCWRRFDGVSSTPCTGRLRLLLLDELVGNAGTLAGRRTGLTGMSTVSRHTIGVSFTSVRSTMSSGSFVKSMHDGSSSGNEHKSTVIGGSSGII